jgi:hypothetical protein
LTGLGSFGEQGDDPADVERLQALRHAATAEQVLDGGRVHLRVPLQQLVDDEGAHLVGTLLGQRSLEGTADRGADGVDDHGFWHLARLLRSKSGPKD